MVTTFKNVSLYRVVFLAYMRSHMRCKCLRRQPHGSVTRTSLRRFKKDRHILCMPGKHSKEICQGKTKILEQVDRQPACQWYKAEQNAGDSQHHFPKERSNHRENGFKRQVFGLIKIVLLCRVWRRFHGENGTTEFGAVFFSRG